MLDETLCPTHRYVILCAGLPVYTTDQAEDLLVYLWGRVTHEDATHPLYMVLDYEVPYVVETGNLCAWLARLPVDVPLPRPEIPLRPERAPLQCIQRRYQKESG